MIQMQQDSVDSCDSDDESLAKVKLLVAASHLDSRAFVTQMTTTTTTTTTTTIIITSPRQPSTTASPSSFRTRVTVHDLPSGVTIAEVAEDDNVGVQEEEVPAEATAASDEATISKEGKGVEQEVTGDENVASESVGEVEEGEEADEVTVAKEVE
jgi:hypothetical protein